MGENFLAAAAAYPNVMVGRTFSKAYGLAGMRVGVLCASPAVLEPMRRCMPLFNLNVVAVAALRAALADPEYRAWYLDQAAQSKALVYAACDKLGLKYWRSAANFVLIDGGDAGEGDRVGHDWAWRVRARSQRGSVVPELLPRHRRRAGAHAEGRGRAGGRMRRAVIDRRTAETQIRFALNVDGTGKFDNSTGIRFLDHMLDLVARHGGFDLTVKATGDLDVDQHHTVEDVGIALGEAVAKALGDKRGINRAGYFVMPMDETLAVAAIDLSGRPAHRRRHQGEGARRRRSADGAGPRLLRGVRHGRSRQRAPEGAVRPLEPPQDRGLLQGVRPRAARGLREGQAPGEDAAQHEGPAVIALVDYGAGNLTSVRKALTAVGASFWTPASPEELAPATGIIVPGVGHFSATAALDDSWKDAIRASLARGVPLLGICVGLQWLFEGSTEAPGVAGLGVHARHLLAAPEPGA